MLLAIASLDRFECSAPLHSVMTEQCVCVCALHIVMIFICFADVVVVFPHNVCVYVLVNFLILFSVYVWLECWSVCWFSLFSWLVGRSLFIRYFGIGSSSSSSAHKNRLFQLDSGTYWNYNLCMPECIFVHTTLQTYMLIAINLCSYRVVISGVVKRHPHAEEIRGIFWEKIIHKNIFKCFPDKPSHTFFIFILANCLSSSISTPMVCLNNCGSFFSAKSTQ